MFEGCSQTLKSLTLVRLAEETSEKDKVIDAIKLKRLKVNRLETATKPGILRIISENNKVFSKIDLQSNPKSETEFEAEEFAMILSRTKKLEMKNVSIQSIVLNPSILVREICIY